MRRIILSSPNHTEKPHLLRCNRLYETTPSFENLVRDHLVSRSKKVLAIGSGTALPWEEPALNH